MFSLLKTCAILLAVSLGCVSAGPHPPASNGDWKTLEGTGPSAGRTFRIWAPGPSDCSSIPYSVILAFHGRGGDPDRMSRVSRFHKSARPAVGQCSIVIYPKGLPSSIADPRPSWQPAPYANPSADDLQFVRDILQWVQDAYGTYANMRQVYASGKSNGAALVAWLACRMSDKIAAFAPVSGPLYRAQDLITPDPTCDPVRKVPIIEFHGTDDTDAPYCNYRTEWEGGRISTVMAWVRWWAKRNGCSLSPARTSGPSHVVGLRRTEIETYTSCDAGSSVVHYRIVHGLHDWPSFDLMDDNKDDESNPSLWVPTCPGWGTWSPGPVEATDIIMAFFRQWELP